MLTPWLAPAREVVADTAYDSDALRALIAQAGAIAVIPPHPTRRQPLHVDPCAYAKRHHIEQSVNRLKQFRRLASRFDKFDASFLAFVALRVSILYLIENTA